MTSDALLSPCGTYRYWLTRTWDPTKQHACFVMLNPSTADASVDDPTVKRCVGFAHSFGCGGLSVVNLFALRATDPDELKPHRDPVGAGNLEHVVRAALSGFPVVAAWGTRGGLRGQDRRVVDALREVGVSLFALGWTMRGHPKHPLYLKAGTPLIPFPTPEGGAPS